MRPTARLRFMAIATAISLGACGGGVGSEPTSTATENTTTSSVAEPTTTVVAETTTTVEQTPTTDQVTVPTSVAKPGPGDIEAPFVLTGIDLAITGSDPAQVSLIVSAELPTPCYETSWEVDDDGSVVAVVLRAKTDPDVICTDVIQEVELDIDLGDFPAGSTRTVTLNGDAVGDFDL